MGCLLRSFVFHSLWHVVPNELLVQVHNTFRDLEESNILRSYMSDAIKEIAKACQAFEVKESAPSAAGAKTLYSSCGFLYFATSECHTISLLQSWLSERFKQRSQKFTYLNCALGCEQQQKTYQKRKRGFLYLFLKGINLRTQSLSCL